MRKRGISWGALEARLGMSSAELSRAMQKGITYDLAQRLAKVFDTSPECWIEVQRRHDRKTY